jgi:signal peptidase I
VLPGSGADGTNDHEQWSQQVGNRAFGTDGAAGTEEPGAGGVWAANPGAQGPGSADPAAEGPADPAGRKAKGRWFGKRARGGKPRPWWQELPLLVVIALVLALIIKTFFVQAFSIPSDSMQNTLQKGDRVLVDKLTPWFGAEPERGDVVVFHDPDNWLADEPVAHPNALQKALSFVGLLPSANERDLIKRVIGVAGDTVECEGTGPVKVNGKPLDEPYVYPGNTACSTDQGGQFKVTVPAGTIWVMGDHRQDSADSRYHQDDKTHGFVPVSDVVGRAFVVAWPINRWATLPVPGTFGQPGIAAAAAPGAVGLSGAVPLVLWRRRRLGAAAFAGRGTTPVRPE